MRFFKKIILITVMWTAFPSVSESLLSLPLFYPVKNFNQFDETSRYISGLRYSWVVSSYFPEHVQQILGNWHLQFGGGWLHTVPRKRAVAPKKSISAVSKSAKDTEKKKKIKTLISYYPALVEAGLIWELNHLHYVKPLLGFGYVWNNPLNNETLLQQSFLDQKSYFITMGFLLSFDLVDSNFSHRMNYEYNIRDMGLFVEYRKYSSLKKAKDKEGSRWGWNVGLYMAF